jgi:hydroxyacylglutathione hydrolase
VDPSEGEPVERALSAAGLRLDAIWLTHHHHDHVGGVEALCATRPGLPVLGSAYDLEQRRIPCQSVGLREGDRVALGASTASVLEIPGHTLGAIAFVVDGCLFSGDTLFLGGCGRVFEGTMPMMQSSLAKLRALPDDTRVYCGHEYTQSNLRFALSIEPGSAEISAAQEHAEARRGRGEPTVPGTLAEERATNPFLRWDVPQVIEAARARGANGALPGEVFGALRKAKDTF